MNIPDTLRSIKTSLSERSRERKRLRGPAPLYYAIADAIGMLDALIAAHVVRAALRAGAGNVAVPPGSGCRWCSRTAAPRPLL